MFGHIVYTISSVYISWYHCIIISHHLIISSAPAINASTNLQAMYPCVSSTNLGPCHPMNLDDVHGPKNAFAAPVSDGIATLAPRFILSGLSVQIPDAEEKTQFGAESHLTLLDKRELERTETGSP